MTTEQVEKAPKYRKPREQIAKHRTNIRSADVVWIPAMAAIEGRKTVTEVINDALEAEIKLAAAWAGVSYEEYVEQKLAEHRAKVKES